MFHVTLNGGFIDVENGPDPNPIYDYKAKVACSTMVGSGPGAVVYAAGPVVESTGANGITGDWLFAAFTAGGPGVGTTAGQLAPYGSCYDGKNAALTGPAFVITSGVVRISS